MEQRQQGRSSKKRTATVVRLGQVEQISGIATGGGSAVADSRERQRLIQIKWCCGWDDGLEWNLLSVTIRAQLIISRGSVSLYRNDCSGGEGDPGNNVIAWTFAGAKLDVSVFGDVCRQLWGTRGGVGQRMAGSWVSFACMCAWYLYLWSIGKSSEERAKEGSDGEEVGVVPSKYKKPLKKARFHAYVLVPGPSRDVSEEVIVGLTARWSVRLDSADDEQSEPQWLDWLCTCRDSNFVECDEDWFVVDSSIFVFSWKHYTCFC